MPSPCECADPACPACHGRCRNAGRVLLYRIDMADETGTLFCEPCADDAASTALYHYGEN